ncbi:AMP-binding protein [Streptomyces sp. NPDC094468]|uniref:AMP-binding protein n=1 Tax=Streptomyces sp. NPDC094468 TaxID=3366066 RepID=UPI0037FDF44E
MQDKNSDAHTRDEAADRQQGFRRPVSPNEWLYLAFEQRSGAPFVIQLVVEGKGTIEPGALRRAVAEASQACPGARLRLARRTWVDSGQTPVVREVTDLGAGLRAPLDPSAGRSCEVVIRAGEQPTTLVFRAHHAVMDGRGLLSWALDVFRALRGEELVGATSPLSDLGFLGEQIGSGAAPRRQRQQPKWPSPLGRTARPTASPEPSGRARHQETRVHWARRTLDGVHHDLVAKIAAAATDASGAAARIMIPVDLRRHRPGLRATGNLTLPIFLEGRPGRHWSAWRGDLLGALMSGDELAAGEERRALRLPQRALHLLGSLAGTAVSALGRYPCTALVSHLGHIEPEDVHAPGFAAGTAYSIPVQVPIVPVSFTTLEFGRHTQLVVSAGVGQDIDAAEVLLDAVCETLSPVRHRRMSGGRVPEAQAATLTSLLRHQVGLTPDAVALTGPEGPVSYLHLDRRSDVVAGELCARGIGPGSVVGLLADRTPAAIAGLWGVLKAGAAYLPLDPGDPPARISAVLADADAALCLAGAAYESLPAADCPFLVLDTLPVDGAQPVDEIATPDCVAYVIYTSGSTGVPKGVQVEHRALVAYTRWAGERYGIDATSRFALFTSLAFDLTGTAIFLPLLAGGSIALVPGQVDHCTFPLVLTRSGANALKITPAHLDLITSLGVEPQGFRSLVVGGEQLRGPTAARAQRLFGSGCRIYNEYGPTEATIGCVVHTFDPELDGDRPTVPIGLPVDGTGVVLLDGDGRPAGPGETGELHLTGVQLARGYLNRPELDRERFVNLADGTRAYRTGDLARLARQPSAAALDADGCAPVPPDDHGAFEFLGRTDDQLSIRGFRIEPGEVETVLERYPQVTGAVVASRLGPRDEPLLCAWVTVTGGWPEPEVVRDHAARLLPPHLVPTVVRVVDAFALTVNGKVDRAALPSPFKEDPPTWGTASAKPDEDPLTTAVAAIWARVLGVPARSIGSAEAFHQFGGDSLSLLLMLTDVAADLVREEGQQAFQDALRGLLSNVTVERVCAAIRTVNAGQNPGAST